jgi:hypothetical protein
MAVAVLVGPQAIVSFLTPYPRLHLIHVRSISRWRVFEQWREPRRPPFAQVSVDLGIAAADIGGGGGQLSLSEALDLPSLMGQDRRCQSLRQLRGQPEDFVTAMAYCR